MSGLTVGEFLSAPSVRRMSSMEAFDDGASSVAGGTDVGSRISFAGSRISLASNMTIEESSPSPSVVSLVFAHRVVVVVVLLSVRRPSVRRPSVQRSVARFANVIFLFLSVWYYSREQMMYRGSVGPGLDDPKTSARIPRGVDWHAGVCDEQVC